MRTLLAIALAAAVAAAAPKTRRERVAIPVWTDGEALEPAAVQARLAGKEVRVEAVRGPGDDLLLLLILDLSGDVGLAETAREALAKETEDLPPSAWVGLMRAQDGLRVLLDPTADRAELARAIRETPPGSYAGLLDSVQTVMELADDILRKSAVRVAVLYVTDSDVRRYREDFTNPVINASDPRDLSRRFPEGLVQEKIRKVDATLALLEVPLFVVHLDYRSDRLNEAYQAGLKQLAATTGGAGEFCRSPAEIPEAIRRSLQRIASHHSVVVAMPPRAPRVIPVELRAAGRTLVHRMQVASEGR
ncbi:MAG: hypothetical protein K6T59_11100 [Bryobacteraceae bacterium]|jgi:hypothetical protein|nr:hypothetical protein [Bryobacteraceae bacterium]